MNASKRFDDTFVTLNTEILITLSARVCHGLWNYLFEPGEKQKDGEKGKVKGKSKREKKKKKNKNKNKKKEKKKKEKKI